jgi:hypothetical protein
LGTEILFDWLLGRIAFLSLDNEFNFLIAMSSLFHSLTAEGINDELVIESLQKGTIKLSPFRKRPNSQSNKISVPKLYYYGPRKLNVILTQLRCTASFLNHDLCNVHILSSPACSCGAPQEDANHFFFVCTKYSEIRNDLFLSISDLSQLINTSLLTSGSEALSHIILRMHKKTRKIKCYHII